MNTEELFELINFKDNLYPLNYKLIKKVDSQDSAPNMKFVKNTDLGTDTYTVRSSYKPISKILSLHE